MADIYDWSTTAASNATADSGINWAEGQNPNTVNNSARQMMGRVAEFVGDIGGALAAGGTADAITVTANSGFTAYAAGQLLAIKAASDNTGAVTLNVNGIGTKAIRKVDSTGDVALSAGDIKANSVVFLAYNTSFNSGAGAWQLLNNAGQSSTYQPSDAGLTDIAALAVTDGNIIVGDGANWVAESGATARTSLGLAIGTDVQAYDATLASLSSLGTAADKITYTTGVDTWAETGITAGGRALVNLTGASNKIPRFTSASAAGTIDFLDEDNMSSNSASAVASQQSIKAYVDANAGVTAPTTSTLGVGHWALCKKTTAGTVINGATLAGSEISTIYFAGTTLTAGTAQSGTWKNISGITLGQNDSGLFVRTV